MTDLIIDFPREYESFATIVFRTRSTSQVSPRPWAGGNSIYGPHAQLWIAKIEAGQVDGDDWQERAALFDWLGGQAGLIRMYDPIRKAPLYNRKLAAAAQGWSDGTRFSDGTDFVDGLLPPTAFLVDAASRGDTSIVLGGLLPNLAPALYRGDLLELRPNGIADGKPRLHSVMVRGNTDSSGQTGVEIRPPLRSDYAAGDMVVLDHAASVFHLVDDDQGEMTIARPYVGNYAFQLIEAIERAT